MTDTGSARPERAGKASGRPAGKGGRAAAPSPRRSAREFALQGLYQWLLSGEDAGVVDAHIRGLEGFGGKGFSTQRGLGMGGGGAISARGAATAVHKLTWILAAGFICTSIALTLVAAQKSAGTSVLDRLGDTPAASEAPATSTPPLGTDNLLPPSEGDNAPLVPKAD